MKKSSVFVYGLLFLSLIAYTGLAYLTPRTYFYQLLLLIGFLFVAYGLILRLATTQHLLVVSIVASVIFRLVWLPAVPQLSDDFFRFIWDGRLLAQGINPYLVLPSAFYTTPEASAIGISSLFESLNSPNYYTVYPPVLQTVFALGAWLFPDNMSGNIIVMRVIIIAAEAGSFSLLFRLLRQFKLSSSYLLLYALNPLVITELTGNLHFEAVMIFWLLLSVWLIIRKRLIFSAFCFALAVGTKLIPLLFLPFLLKRIGIKKSLIFYSVVGITLFLQFLPFITAQLFANIFSSIDLYFQKFEFNASLYYLIRWLGFRIKGYNIIAQAGVVLSLSVFVSVVWLAFREKNLSWKSFFKSMLWSLSIYYLLATTVHPWYITTLVAVSIFTPYRFPMVWSAFVVLSYAAYHTQVYQENLWLTALEYVVVIGFMVYDFFLKKSIQHYKEVIF